MTLATKPGLPEEIRTQSLKLNTPNFDELQLNPLLNSHAGLQSTRCKKP
jgi:hypothetical protein